MFGRDTYAGIGKTEIVEILVLAETADVDAYIRACIGNGIVHQVAENGV